MCYEGESKAPTLNIGGDPLGRGYPLATSQEASYPCAQIKLKACPLYQLVLDLLKKEEV